MNLLEGSADRVQVPPAEEHLTPLACVVVGCVSFTKAHCCGSSCSVFPAVVVPGEGAAAGALEEPVLCSLGSGGHTHSLLFVC